MEASNRVIPSRLVPNTHKFPMNQRAEKIDSWAQFQNRAGDFRSLFLSWKNGCDRISRSGGRRRH